MKKSKEELNLYDNIIKKSKKHTEYKIINLAT